MFKVKGVNMFPAQVEEVIAATSGTSSEYQVMIEHIMGRDVLTVLFETSLEGEALQRCEEELALIFKAKIGCTPDAKGVSIGELPRSEKKDPAHLRQPLLNYAGAALRGGVFCGAGWACWCVWRSVHP